MIRKDIKTIYLDFDNTVVNSIKAICDLYNEDFQYYKGYNFVHWFDINTWEFKELKCATNDYIVTYFNQKRLFDILEFMPYAYETICRLSSYYKIKIVSIGKYPNLKGKNVWLSSRLYGVEFIPVNIDEYSDKSHIDMSDGIHIEDSSIMLRNSNAKEKILFGDTYEYNKDWTGKRLYNFTEIEKYLL